MDNIRQLSANFGQIQPFFVHLSQGVRFGLQTLSFRVLFIRVSIFKNNRKSNVSAYRRAFSLIPVLFCLLNRFSRISPRQSIFFLSPSPYSPGGRPPPPGPPPGLPPPRPPPGGGPSGRPHCWGRRSFSVAELVRGKAVNL
jgi:hypothetical protein